MATAAETMFPSLCSSSTGTDHVITYLSFTRQQDEKESFQAKNRIKKVKKTEMFSCSCDVQSEQTADKQ